MGVAGGALWDVLGRHPLLTGGRGLFHRATQRPLLSFWLGTGVPGEEAWQFEDRIPAARIRQRQGLRGRLLPGALLWHREELGGLRREGGGRGAVGAAMRAGGQGRLRDGDGGWESADLQVGGLLCFPLILSDFLHGHVCGEEGVTTVGI